MYAVFACLHNICIVSMQNSMLFSKLFIALSLFGVLCLTETKKQSRRKVFCQITQHLLENHEMWKRVIAELPEENQPENSNYIANQGDTITAIHEEEEEQASKEEEEEEKEESANCLDNREQEVEILPQSETSGENEEEPQ